MNKKLITKSSFSGFHRNPIAVAVALACISLGAESSFAASTSISTSSTTQQALTGTDTLTVTSTGSINTAVSNSAAVSVTGDTGVTIINAGTIGSGVGSNIGQATGINIQRALIGAITNSGSITANSIATSNNALAYGIFEGYYRITALGSINNTGNISATSNASASNAYAYGIWFEYNAGVGSTLNNSSTISATANSLNSASAYGVDYYYNNYGILTNATTGVISATATSANGYAIAHGIHVSTNLGDTNTPSNGAITNHGTISATANGKTGASAIGISVGSTLKSSITNTGSITANAHSTAGGANAYGVNIGTLNGSLTNSGSISGTADNPANGYSISADLGTGTITNLQGGLLSGNLYSGGSISVNNAGTIALPDAILARISGNYTQTSTGVLSIGASSASSHGALNVGGTASISGGANVNVANINTLAIGNALTGVVTAGTLVGNFSYVSDNSALFNFVSVLNGNSIDFDVVKGTTATSAVLSTGNNAGIGAAGAIDSIISANVNGQIATLFLPLTTTQQVSNAISQTLPSLAGGHNLALGNVLHDFNRIVQARQESEKGRSSGDDFLVDKHIWFKPFGSWADQSNRNGATGYSANTYGMVFGADAEASDTNRVGVAFAYAHTNLDGSLSTAPQNSRINSYQLIGYGSHSLDDNTDLSFQADVGKNDTDGSRSILFMNSAAKASYSGWSGHLGAALARTYDLSEGFAFTPSVRADYTTIRSDAYTETGAGALNLNVGSSTTDQLILGVDGKISHSLTEKTKLTANLGAGYDVINDGASITSAFAGSPTATFVTNGINPNPWLARGGLGLVGNLENGVELSARYDFEVRNGFDNQTASVKVRWAF